MVLYGLFLLASLAEVTVFQYYQANPFCYNYIKFI
jgi:hypothetical protein